MFARVRALIRHRLSVSPPEQSLPAISRWFESPMGQALLARQRQDIDEALHCLFGYHLCQLTVSPDLDLAQASRISHTFGLTPCAARGPVAQGQIDYGRLPLAPESVDVILLHHALDFSQTPHQLLAEASRALIPRGHLVIVGFNPVSILGLWRKLLCWIIGSPEWRQQTLRKGRLADWLALLELELVASRQGWFWPVQSAVRGPVERWLRRLGAPGGGYYVLTVRKEIAAAIAVKPRWVKPALGSLRGAGLTGERTGSRRSTNNIK